MSRQTFLKSTGTRRYCLGCALITGILMLVFGVLVVVYVETLINAYINKSLAFSEDSPTFQSWSDPPVAIKTKVYFFNLTNPVAFFNGTEKPRFNEVGPFIIGEKWERRNVVFNKNGTMTSQLYKIMKFLPEESVSDQFTNITTLNVPLASAVASGRWQDTANRRAVNALANVFGDEVLITRSVDQLVFGYKSKFVDFARNALPPGQAMPYDKFGFFVGKNATLSPPLLLNTGASNWRDIGRVERFDGSRTLPFWNSRQCNLINGSDGAMFPPGATENDTIYLFASDLCRSLPLEFEKYAYHSDVQTLRFTPPRDVFASPDERADNMCFCVDGPPCAPSGLFNISKCQYGSPTFMSFPHFYLADPAVLEKCDGLKPEKEKHQFFIDLAPRVGVAMQAKIRMQINFHIGPVPDVDISSSMPDMYFPVLWMEAGVDQLPDQTISLVQQAMHAPAVARTSMTAVTFVLAAVLLMLAATLLLRRRWQHANKMAAKNGVTTTNGGGDTGGGGGGGGVKTMEMADTKPAYVPFTDNSTAI